MDNKKSDFFGRMSLKKAQLDYLNFKIILTTYILKLTTFFFQKFIFKFKLITF